MKRLLTLLVGMLICTSIVQAGEVKIKAVMSTGSKDKPATSFATDTPKVLVLFKTTGAQKGDKIRGVWIADDTGGAAPANTKIDEATLNLEGDTDKGEFSCSKPTKGWPAGKYHVDVYANDKLATTMKFTMESAEKSVKEPAEKATTKHEPAAKPDKESEEESADDESADDSSGDDQYTFKVHNGNVQRITKLLASEDGKDYANFDIGKGIDVGETVQLNWDKSTNKTSCHWFIKAVYADKSIGEAVKFDFCEEDLLIDF